MLPAEVEFKLNCKMKKIISCCRVGCRKHRCPSI